MIYIYQIFFNCAFLFPDPEDTLLGPLQPSRAGLRRHRPVRRRDPHRLSPHVPRPGLRGEIPYRLQRPLPVAPQRQEELQKRHLSQLEACV